MGTLEEKIGYRFKKPELLQLALTHSSYSNEMKKQSPGSNERLEFLGDALLGYITATHLYKNLGDMSEGELTRLRAAIVCEPSLYDIARTIGIGPHLMLGKGEEQSGGRDRISILADAVEAILAAIYLDGGIKPAEKFVHRFVTPMLARHTGARITTDYKTALQEIVQRNREETLGYQLGDVTGPDHDRRFTAQVLINSNVFAQGEGRSKKEAEQSAARAALEMMGAI